MCCILNGRIPKLIVGMFFGGGGRIFSLVGLRSWSLNGFHGISVTIGYLMPNPFYKNILSIYDL